MSTEMTDTTGPAIDVTEDTATDPGTSTDPEAVEETTEDTEVHDGADDGQDEPDDGQDEPDDGPVEKRLKREAATSRRKLREAQADRDRLAGIVERFQRTEVERLLDGKLAVPADVWLDGAVDLADLLDEGGLVEARKLDEVLAGVIERHPNWQYRPPGHRAQGMGGAHNRPEPPTGHGAAGLTEAFGTVLGRR